MASTNSTNKRELTSEENEDEIIKRRKMGEDDEKRKKEEGGEAAGEEEKAQIDKKEKKKKITTAACFAAYDSETEITEQTEIKSPKKAAAATKEKDDDDAFSSSSSSSSDDENDDDTKVRRFPKIRLPDPGLEALDNRSEVSAAPSSMVISTSNGTTFMDRGSILPSEAPRKSSSEADDSDDSMSPTNVSSIMNADEELQQTMADVQDIKICHDKSSDDELEDLMANVQDVKVLVGDADPTWGEDNNSSVYGRHRSASRDAPMRDGRRSASRDRNRHGIGTMTSTTNSVVSGFTSTTRNRSVNSRVRKNDDAGSPVPSTICTSVASATPAAPPLPALAADDGDAKDDLTTPKSGGALPSVTDNTTDDMTPKKHSPARADRTSTSPEKRPSQQEPESAQEAGETTGKNEKEEAAPVKATPSAASEDASEVAVIEVDEKMMDGTEAKEEDEKKEGAAEAKEEKKEDGADDSDDDSSSSSGSSSSSSSDSDDENDVELAIETYSENTAAATDGWNTDGWNNDKSGGNELALSEKKDENSWNNNDWSNDWNKDDEWEPEPEEEKITPEQEKLYEEIKGTQATREDILRIMQFPTQDVLEEEGISGQYRSREEAILDLFVRVNVNWNGQDMCLLARTEAFVPCEPYLVTDANLYGKEKRVRHAIRVRRGTYAKVFTAQFISQLPCQISEFSSWYDWALEDGSIPSPSSMVLAKQRLDESRKFAFDATLIEILAARNREVRKKTLASQILREAKSRADSLRHQLQAGLVHSRDIPSVAQQLRKAEQELEDAEEIRAVKNDEHGRNNSKLFGISTVNNRNMAKQQRLDRAVALAAKKALLAGGDTKILNPFSRRECNPVVMWDVGKGPESAMRNETRLQLEEQAINQREEVHLAGGSDRDMFMKRSKISRLKDANAASGLQALEDIAPAPGKQITDGSTAGTPANRSAPSTPMLTFGGEDDAPLRKILSAISHNGSREKPKCLMPPPTEGDSAAAVPHGVDSKRIISFADWRKKRGIKAT